MGPRAEVGRLVRHPVSTRVVVPFSLVPFSGKAFFACSLFRGSCSLFACSLFACLFLRGSCCLFARTRTEIELERGAGDRVDRREREKSDYFSSQRITPCGSLLPTPSPGVEGLFGTCRCPSAATRRRGWPASERGGNTSKGCKDFYVKANARIRP